MLSVIGGVPLRWLRGWGGGRGMGDREEVAGLDIELVRVLGECEVCCWS